MTELPGPADDGTAANRALVRRYIETCFNAHDPGRAAAECLHVDYRQHNPHVPTGRAAYLAHFEPFMAAHPQSSCTVKRIVAEGDMVVVHSHWQLRPDDRGMAVVDLYRIADGLICEHWDVIQDVPDHMAHDNGMF